MLKTARSEKDRLDAAFRFALSRPAGDRERAILQKSLQSYRRHFKSDKEAAAGLLAAGESPVPFNTSSGELAAWTTICSTILNLDECVTKE